MQYIHSAILNAGLTQIVLSTLVLIMFTSGPISIMLLRDRRLSTLQPLVKWYMLTLINHHTLFTNSARNYQMVANILVAGLMVSTGWFVAAEIFIINALIILPIYHHVAKRSAYKRLICDIVNAENSAKSTVIA